MKNDTVFQERRARISELRAKNERMTCRERAMASVKHKEPDRVPIDNWMVPEIQKKTMEYFGCDSYEELLEFLGVDFRNNYGPSYVGQSFKKHPDGTVEDLWGVKRKTVTYGKGTAHQGTYTEVAESPMEKMKTLAEIENTTTGPARAGGIIRRSKPTAGCTIRSTASSTSATGSTARPSSSP